MWYPAATARWLVPSLALALCAGVGVAPAVAADAVVTDVRVGQHGQTTRLVFDLTRPVAFTVFSLANPYRVVLDLPEVGWRLPPRALPGGVGLLKRLRYGLFKSGTTRVVLDVSGPAAIDKAFLLTPSGARAYRLVLDLAKTTRRAFLRQSKGPGVRVRAVQASPGKPAAPPPSAGRARPAARTASASPDASFRPPLRKPQRSQRVVVLDPGHGGVDPGTIGVSGVREKNITLAIAREIGAQLKRTGRFRVVLTRDRDIFVPLRDRVAVARRTGADLFVSIHADAIRNARIRGLSVYTLSEKASDQEAAELAERENKADLIGGVDLSDHSPEVTNILIDLAQRETMNQSARFASRLVKEFSRETRLLRNTHRFAGFRVLKAPDVPSVLLEMGFLSNRSDDKALRSKGYRKRLAAAVVRAAERYFDRVEEASRK